MGSIRGKAPFESSGQLEDVSFPLKRQLKAKTAILSHVLADATVQLKEKQLEGSG